MKMLVLLGSPRKNGNSETIAKTVASVFEENGGSVEYVRLNDLSLRPCQGCGGCDKSGMCVVKDDMIGLYELVDVADSILLVSPVYFYGLSAQCKIFGDRMQARWARKYLLKERCREDEMRKGYLLSTAATRGAKIFDCSVLTSRYIFDAMDVEYGGDLLIKGVDKRKAVLDHPEEIKKAADFGREIVSAIRDGR
ncbi:FMN reductase [Desulfomarina profundi]|uniref:FMN reductase n=1 Tax=Desulfomarina profundi TaxID=2772557 RepID=A0A8D5FS20_9BACT|nr:flavodoxin family protein [Desulfomarina profundi]BCL62625.1 FMN reductase [Desulfomarina profundi]